MEPEEEEEVVQCPECENSHIRFTYRPRMQDVWPICEDCGWALYAYANRNEIIEFEKKHAHIYSKVLYFKMHIPFLFGVIKN